MSDNGVGLDSAVLRDLFGTPEMRAVMDGRALIQGWLDAEAALARSEAVVGVIPRAAGERITAEARAENFDIDAIRDGIAESRHPLVPLIRALVAQCGEFGGWVHWGATTQDIIDTGAMLQVRSALALIAGDLEASRTAARDLAARHDGDPLPGRTHGQHAVPISFGQKVDSWASELDRALDRLAHLQRHGLCGQLGGAAGSLAALGKDAPAVREAFAAELQMPVPTVAWHASRDRVRDVAHVLSQVAAVGERIAAEIVRLQATEVSELRELDGPGHVGSSTMPQKQNPMTSEYLVACARLVHGLTGALNTAAAHAGERDMGLWAVEWMAIPEALVLTSSVASKLAEILAGLVVDTARMRLNVDLTRGAIMAEAVMMDFASRWGREHAHAIVSRASRLATTEALTLDAALALDPDVAASYTAEELRALVGEPQSYLGA